MRDVFVLSVDCIWRLHALDFLGMNGFQDKQQGPTKRNKARNPINVYLYHDDLM